jgi:signal transduction histidine kinase
VLVPVVHAAALRGERVVSISRAVFCVLVLIRFLIVEKSRMPAPWVLNCSALGSATAYSLWILWRMRAGAVTYGMLAGSVAIDCVGCFASLLQTVLWPAAGDHFRGLLTTPDISAILLIVYCAGFRVWPSLSLLGAALNLLSYVTLVATEMTLARKGLDYGLAEATMFFFVLASVIVLSVGTARRTLQLASAGASATLQVERARQRLAELVREHHDARSAISAAALTSDMMMRALAEGGTPRAEPDVRQHAERLRDDLTAVRKQLADLGEKAYMHLTALGHMERVETGRVVGEAVSALSLRFPELTVDADATPAGDLMVVGGAASVRRILDNVVANAREGDGRSGASRVDIRASSEGGKVTLLVEDDGPGFGDAVLRTVGSVPTTTKRSGMGLGLLMTSELVRLSGGTLTLGNRPSGGGELRITLPAADPSSLRPDVDARVSGRS